MQVKLFDFFMFYLSKNVFGYILGCALGTGRKKSLKFYQNYFKLLEKLCSFLDEGGGAEGMVGGPEIAL